jgi:hypothetical protein
VRTKRYSREKQLEVEWYKGYVCAVAKLVIMHGSGVEAMDLIREGGGSRIPWGQIDSYDREILQDANLLPTTAEAGKEGA